MTDQTTEPSAKELAERWAGEYQFVRDRLAHWAEQTGTRRLPVRFGGEALRAFRARLPIDAGSPLVYAVIDDRLHVDPVMLFGSPVDDPGVIAGADGLLLHELGHRRDRLRINRRIVLTWIAGPLLLLLLGGSMIIEIVHGSETDGSSGLSLASGVTLAVFAALWFGLDKLDSRPSRLARYEIRADDYAADIGGMERWDCACDVMASMEVPDPLGIYLPVEERRARQQERLQGRAE